MTNDKELLYYYLGIIASDGHMDKSKPRIELGLHIRDSDIVCKLSQRIYGKLRNVYVETEKNRIRLIVNDKQIFNLLKSYGIHSRKSETLNMNLDSIPNEYFKHFLRGFIDGDESYTYKNINNFHLRIVGNYSMMTKINEFVKKYYNICGNVYKITTDASFQMYSWNVQVTESAKKLVDLIYKDSTLFIERKYSIVKKALSAV